MTTSRETRIRERAYALWTRDGQPEGRQDEFWHRACDEIGREEAQHSAQGSGSGQRQHESPEANAAGALGTLQAEEAGLIGADAGPQGQQQAARPGTGVQSSGGPPSSQHGIEPDAAGALGTLQAEDTGLIGGGAERQAGTIRPPRPR